MKLYDELDLKYAENINFIVGMFCGVVSALAMTALVLASSPYVRETLALFLWEMPDFK